MNKDWDEEQKVYEESKENKDKVINDILSKNSKINNGLTNKPKEDKNLIKPFYKSKDGYVKSKIYRGFQEIKYIFDIIKSQNLNCFICGGYVRYMCSPKRNPYQAGDVDIYSHTQKDFDILLKILKKDNMSVKFENDVSVTFANLNDRKHPLFISPTIQLIKPLKQGAMVLKGTMEDILDNFDFTVVRCGLINENKAIVDADFEHDEIKSLLRIKNIHCPISSTLRCMKYAKKGYWMTPFESLKLFINWENRDDSYRMKIIDMVKKFEDNGITKEEIEKLEALMRID